MVELQQGVDGLQHRENQQHNGGDKREKAPRAAEVSVLQVGPPPVPAPPEVIFNLPIHVAKDALRGDDHVLGEAVEQLGGGLIAPERVLDDILGLQQADVLGGVDDAVHEHDVGSDLVAGADIEALEGHEVEKHVLRAVVDCKLRQAEDTVLELDVKEAVGFALPEADAGLAQLRRRPDDRDFWTVFLATTSGRRRLLAQPAKSEHVKEVAAFSFHRQRLVPECQHQFVHVLLVCRLVRQELSGNYGHRQSIKVSVTTQSPRPSTKTSLYKTSRGSWFSNIIISRFMQGTVYRFPWSLKMGSSIS